MQVDRRQAFGGLDLVEQGGHEQHVCRRAHLGDQDRVQPCAGPFDHLDDVAVAPVRVEPVDADGDGARRPVLPVQGGDHVLAGLFLVVRRDRVLEVEEDHVRSQRGRLLQGAGVAARHRKLAAMRVERVNGRVVARYHQTEIAGAQSGRKRRTPASPVTCR